MVLSASQQVVVAFTAVLFTFVVLPRMFGGTGAKETRGFDQRYNRKGPGSVRSQPSMSTAGSAQNIEGMQQMKMMMEQEMKNDKFQSKSNKGYVFTLMPLYAIGVGVFAAYKFLKVKSADDSRSRKDKGAKGAKKSAEAENQLNELEQRLAQTERMLNSILTQLDPLTNCVKSVAQEQKNEIMTQLQTIRCLMKKRGMDCQPLNRQEGSGERNLDDLIESLAARDTLPADASLEKTQAYAGRAEASEQLRPQAEELGEHIPEEECPQSKEVGEQLSEEELLHAEELGEQLSEEELLHAEEVGEQLSEEEEREGSEEEEEEEEDEMEDSELMASLEESYQKHIQDIGGLRRRTRPE